MENVYRLPVARKRGPKVRKGPQAAVLDMPSSTIDRYVAFLRIGARPEDKPGDREQLRRAIIAMRLESMTIEQLRLELEDRIANRRAKLENELAELDRV